MTVNKAFYRFTGGGLRRSVTHKGGKSLYRVNMYSSKMKCCSFHDACGPKESTCHRVAGWLITPGNGVRLGTHYWFMLLTDRTLHSAAARSALVSESPCH